MPRERGLENAVPGEATGSSCFSKRTPPADRKRQATLPGGAVLRAKAGLLASDQGSWVTDMAPEAPKALAAPGFELGTVGLALSLPAPYHVAPVHSRCSVDVFWVQE